jgi:hypothetical protein
VIYELGHFTTVELDYRAILLQLLFTTHYTIGNIVASRGNDRQRGAQLMRDGGNEFHLQLG